MNTMTQGFLFGLGMVVAYLVARMLMHHYGVQWVGVW